MRVKKKPDPANPKPYNEKLQWLKLYGSRPEKPAQFDEMIRLAENLAAGTVELRVDFYDANGSIYFGERTLFDGSGFDRIKPIEWDD